MPLCRFGMLGPRQVLAFPGTEVPGLTPEVNEGKNNHLFWTNTAYALYGSNTPLFLLFSPRYFLCLVLGDTFHL